MFLFRRKKEKPEDDLEAVIKAESLKKEKQDGKEKASNSLRKSEITKTQKGVLPETIKTARVAVKDQPVISVKVKKGVTEESPVKVVIPASALESEETEEDSLPEPAETKEPVPEEVADGLLVKMNQEKMIEDKGNIPEVDLAQVIGKPEKEVTTQPSVAQHIPVPTVAEQSASKNLQPVVTAFAIAQTELPKEKAQPDMQGLGVNSKIKATEETKETVPKTATGEPAKKESDDPAKKAIEGDQKDNLFSNLFSKTEEKEETPIDRLIKSIPDITIEEVMNEAEEVKGLMGEWFQNMGKQ
jgi:hypothetical protein